MEPKFYSFFEGATEARVLNSLKEMFPPGIPKPERGVLKTLGSEEELDREPLGKDAILKKMIKTLNGVITNGSSPIPHPIRVLVMRDLDEEEEGEEIKREYETALNELMELKEKLVRVVFTRHSDYPNGIIYYFRSDDPDIRIAIHLAGQCRRGVGCFTRQTTDDYLLDLLLHTDSSCTIWEKIIARSIRRNLPWPSDTNFTFVCETAETIATNLEREDFPRRREAKMHLTVFTLLLRDTDSEVTKIIFEGVDKAEIERTFASLLTAIQLLRE